ncbi:serine/threonine protein kinase, partial [Saccharopolyspora shandongensis]
LGAAVPAAEPARRNYRQVALWVVAIVVAVLVGVLAANAFGDGAPPEQTGPATSAQSAPPVQQTRSAPTTSAKATTSAPPTTSSSTTSGSPTQPSEDEVVSVVRDYYSLVPKKLDEAWELLGPSLQSQGKDRYEGFWKSIDDVKIVGGPVMSGTNVIVTLQFTKGHNKITESHTLGMVATPDGDVLINTDRRG